MGRVPPVVSENCVEERVAALLQKEIAKQERPRDCPDSSQKTNFGQGPLSLCSFNTAQISKREQRSLENDNLFIKRCRCEKQTQQDRAAETDPFLSGPDEDHQGCRQQNVKKNFGVGLVAFDRQIP